MDSRTWRKSSRSKTSDEDTNCVEVADNVGADTVFVRDTKDRAGGELAPSRGEWSSLLSALRGGAIG